MKFKKTALLFLGVYLGLIPVVSASTPAPTTSLPTTEIELEQVSTEVSARYYGESPVAKPKVEIPIKEFYNESTNTYDTIKLKAAIQKYAKNNPGSSDILENIDAKLAKVNQINQANQQNNAISSDIIVTPLTDIVNGWKPGYEPKLTYDGNWYTYTIAWVAEDNYRSNSPVTVNTKVTTTVSQSLGFTGSAQIKANFGFSASYNESQQAEKSVGLTVPAWTYWATRPYIFWNKKIYEGVWQHIFIDSTGYYEIETPHTGENRTIISKANDYWTKTNTAQNTSAFVQPPASMPY